MLSKYFSYLQNELNFSIFNGIKKLNNYNKSKKIFFIFWIIGPFIYLIERDPADLWLSLISIIFLLRCIIKNDWNWVYQWWFIFSILFWITGLISAILGPYKLFSFQFYQP